MGANAVNTVRGMGKKVMTMAEYIEREKLLRDINHYHLSDGKFQHWVEVQPAADVAPVVHGKWENGNSICPVCGGNKFKDLDADIWCDWQPDFCPNCGAKMDLEE